MKHLSSPNDPVISRRIHKKIILGILVGFLSAYGLLLIIAMVANEILK